MFHEAHRQNEIRCRQAHHNTHHTATCNDAYVLHILTALVYIIYVFMYGLKWLCGFHEKKGDDDAVAIVGVAAFGCSSTSSRHKRHRHRRTALWVLLNPYMMYCIKGIISVSRALETGCNDPGVGGCDVDDDDDDASGAAALCCFVPK